MPNLIKSLRNIEERRSSFLPIFEGIIDFSCDFKKLINGGVTGSKAGLVRRKQVVC